MQAFNKRTGYKPPPGPSKAYAPILRCTHCGVEGRARKVSKFGYFCKESDCRKALNRVRQRVWNAEHPGYYTKHPSRKRYREEVAAGTRPHWRQVDPDLGRAVNQRRRARKAGANCESFRTLDIYERDGWICGICEKPVDRELRYPDPKSASLDHVVPLSLGGDHTRANVRLAHLKCNQDHYWAVQSR